MSHAFCNCDGPTPEEAAGVNSLSVCQQFYTGLFLLFLLADGIRTMATLNDALERQACKEFIVSITS